MNKQEAIEGIKSEKFIGVLTYEEEAYEGEMRFSDGDYLIKNETGECYVCRKGIFEKTYKEVKE